MKFSEAVQKLKEGIKVTRAPWKDSMYFMLDGDDVRSFQPRLVAYPYDEDIMISDGWLVDGGKEQMKFCDIIDSLVRGSKARREDWQDMYIYYDNSIKGIALKSMESLPFTPDFESFVAQDWIEVI